MSEAQHMAPNDDEKQLLDSPRESRWQGVFLVLPSITTRNCSRIALGSPVTELVRTFPAHTLFLATLRHPADFRRLTFLRTSV